MPNCRNCGARLNKFDKDCCPVCGTKNPLEGVDSDTVEFTSQISIKGYEEKINVKRRWIAVLLSFFLGLFGIQFLYLKKYKMAAIWLMANVAVFSALFFILLFTVGWLIALIVSLSVCYLANIIYGIYLIIVPSLKDGSGELVK